MNDRMKLIPRLWLALAALLALASRPASAAAASPPEPPAPPVVPAEAGEVVPREWLDRRITVEEAEAAHPGITDERVRRFPEAAAPFGFENRRWEAFKARLAPGDELWTFVSPAETWRALAGRAGIARVRDGSVRDAMITSIN